MTVTVAFFDRFVLSPLRVATFVSVNVSLPSASYRLPSVGQVNVSGNVSVTEAPIPFEYLNRSSANVTSSSPILLADHEIGSKSDPPGTRRRSSVDSATALLFSAFAFGGDAE